MLWAEHMMRLQTRRILFSQWFGRIDASSVQLRDHLRQFLDPNDRILVTNMDTADWAGYNLDEYIQYRNVNHEYLQTEPSTALSSRRVPAVGSAPNVAHSWGLPVGGLNINRHKRVHSTFNVNG